MLFADGAGGVQWSPSRSMDSARWTRRPSDDEMKRQNDADSGLANVLSVTGEPFSTGMRQ